MYINFSSLQGKVHHKYWPEGGDGDSKNTWTIYIFCHHAGGILMKINKEISDNTEKMMVPPMCCIFGLSQSWESQKTDREAFKDHEFISNY